MVAASKVLVAITTCDTSTGVYRPGEVIEGIKASEAKYLIEQLAAGEMLEEDEADEDADPAKVAPAAKAGE